MTDANLKNARQRVTLTAREGAEYIGISYWLILELVKRRQIPAIRVGGHTGGHAGGRVLFRRESLDLWMSEQEGKVVEKPDTGHGRIRRVQ